MFARQRSCPAVPYIQLASEAGAIYRFDGTVLIDREIFDGYFERFHEPARKVRKEADEE